MIENPYQAPQAHSSDHERPRLSAARGALRGAKLGAIWVGGVIGVLDALVILGLASFGLYRLGDVREVWNRILSLQILGLLLAPFVSAFFGAIICGAIMGIGTAIENRLKR